MDQATQQRENANPAPPQDATAGGAGQMTASRGTTVPPAHRPGWQTTEFWVSVLTIVAMLAGNIQGLPPKYAQIAAAIVASCYALSRAITKLGTFLF